MKIRSRGHDGNCCGSGDGAAESVFEAVVEHRESDKRHPGRQWIVEREDNTMAANKGIQGQIAKKFVAYPTNQNDPIRCAIEDGLPASNLRHDHEELLDRLLSGRLPRTVRWTEVAELIERVGKIEPHGRDGFVFVVGAERAFFKPSAINALEIGDLARLRKFLHLAGLTQPDNSVPELIRVVVVIDHHAARVYMSLGNNQPESEQSIKPYDPHGFHQHLIHRKEAHYRGERVPEEPSFYEAVAKDLLQADEIVLVGHGTGKSSAVVFLADYLKKHHSEISDQVIAIDTLDLPALTDPQIESIAKKHFL
jgi:hypothetical protein